MSNFERITYEKSRYNKNQIKKATISCDFSGLPCGYCYYDGSFKCIGELSYFWISSNDETEAMCIFISYDNSIALPNYYDKTYGFSLRCIKD